MTCVSRRAAARLRRLAMLCGVASASLFLSPEPVAGKGYVIRGNRLEVSGADSWRSWTLPTHAVQVTEEGRVVPRLFRRRYNVLDDAKTFARKLGEFRRGAKEHATLNVDSVETRDVRGNPITKKEKGVDVPVYTYRVRMGISRVGSNAAAAANVVDGDAATYWEPAPADPIDSWWIEVDLGRVVPVDSLVLRFVEEGRGEPFRQFRVLAAPNQVPILESARKVDFELVGRTTAPNRDGRLLSFPLTQREASPEWTGMMVETLRIVVTETKGGRFAPVTASEWEALDPAERGEVVYFIRDEDGFEEPVERSVYESLAPERRGRLDYYRRERPRLADIEVWGYGDNLGPGIAAGGGSLDLSGGGFSPAAGFDGDFSTQFLHAIREKSAIVDRGVLTVDMGGTFWLDEVRTSSTLPRTTIDGYRMLGSDGSRDTSGRLKWRRLSPIEREDNRIDLFEHILEPLRSVRLRYLEIIIINPEVGTRGFSMFDAGPNIAEYQLLTEGYPGEVVLVSDLMELPAGRNLGAIEWQAEVPPNTEVGIRTRTGNLRQRLVRHFDKSGTEITQTQWNNLLGSFKGPVDTTFVTGSDWSNWSRSYRAPGERVTSPSQKGYLQVEVRLTTQDRLRAPWIESIGIELLEPVAERVVGEVWPVSVSQPGELDTFSVYVLPFFVESPAPVRSGGFDEFLMTLTGGSQMSLVRVDVGLGAQGQAGETYARAADGEFVDAGGRRLEVLANGSDSIRVRFPEVMEPLATTAGLRLYHRVTAAADQVPVGRDGQLLTVASYGLLPAAERGERRYYRKEVDPSAGLRLTPVDEVTFDALGPAEREARYFRVLVDEGGQYPFDAAGDTLGASAYGALPTSQRGRVVGTGPLVRVEFASPVYTNGATLDLALRNTAGGAEPAAAWQRIEAGEATALVASESMTIQVPLQVEALADLQIQPDPFTPNGDGVNDLLAITFSVFKLTGQRQAVVQVYRLDGGRVWEERRQVSSGAEAVVWSGRDQGGAPVPPGIYLCRVELDTDASGGGSALTRLVHVAY